MEIPLNDLRWKEAATGDPKKRILSRGLMVLMEALAGINSFPIHDIKKSLAPQDASKVQEAYGRVGREIIVLQDMLERMGDLV